MTDEQLKSDESFTVGAPRLSYMSAPWAPEDDWQALWLNNEGSGGAAQLAVDDDEEDDDEEDDDEEAGRVMFDLLRGAGFDNVNVCYDAGYGEVSITGMAFYRDGVLVEDRDLERQVWFEVKEYLRVTLPDWDEAGSYGRVQLYPTSEYAVFSVIERFEPTCFTRGVPGPDVPDHER